MRRVTVTLPEEVVEEIDRHEANRSRFVLEATLDALERRQQEELRALDDGLRCYLGLHRPATSGESARA